MRRWDVNRTSYRAASSALGGQWVWAAGVKNKTGLGLGRGALIPRCRLGQGRSRARAVARGWRRRRTPGRGAEPASGLGPGTVQSKATANGRRFGGSVSASLCGLQGRPR